MVVGEYVAAVGFVGNVALVPADVTPLFVAVVVV